MHTPDPGTVTPATPYGTTTVTLAPPTPAPGPFAALLDSPELQALLALPDAR